MRVLGRLAHARDQLRQAVVEVLARALDEAVGVEQERLARVHRRVTSS